MSELRLVIFDVDGTLVDSQNLIVQSMQAAFDLNGQPVPDRADIRSIVGLSLELGIEILAQGLSPDLIAAIAASYRENYFVLREQRGTVETSPFFPGAREALDHLREDPWTLLAVATGKSRRGLDKLIEGHGLQGYFTSTQVSDNHPSKPNPAMILAALDETGVSPDRAVMIGDTTFDMQMGRAAKVSTIGVGWGYHAPEDLEADAIIESFHQLKPTVDRLLETRK